MTENPKLDAWIAALGERLHERNGQMMFRPSSAEEWAGFVGSVIDGTFTRPMPPFPFAEPADDIADDIAQEVHLLSRDYGDPDDADCMSPEEFKAFWLRLFAEHAARAYRKGWEAAGGLSAEESKALREILERPPQPLPVALRESLDALDKMESCGVPHPAITALAGRLDTAQQHAAVLTDLATKVLDAIEPARIGGASSWESLLGHGARLKAALEGGAAALKIVRERYLREAAEICRRGAWAGTPGTSFRLDCAEEILAAIDEEPST